MTGVRSEPRSSGITHCITGVDQNHAQHTITLPITGTQHNTLSYHACTTSIQHNGPAYHACTTGVCTTEVAQQAFKMRNVPHRIKKKGCRSRSPDAERIAHHPRRTHRSEK